jgi:hypothetical protein
MISRLVSAIFVLLIAGCVPATSPDSTLGKSIPVGSKSNVYRYIDTEAGVACWLYTGGGIDCMPMSDTNLKR